MHYGATIFITDASIQPAELARELEARDLPAEGWLVASPHSSRAALGAASLALSAYEGRDALA